MDALSSFRKTVERFLSDSQMSATQFGKLALNDPNFIPDLRESGRAPSLKTADKVLSFIREREAAQADAAE